MAVNLQRCDTHVMTSVAQLAIDGIRKLGIDTLFCIPGIQNDDFFDALVDARDIRPVVCRHEQGASLMAMGASQATGKPSAFCVVPGPGMLNAAAGMNSAYWAGGRVLSLIGAIPHRLKGKGTGVLHDLPDPTQVLANLTKHAAYVESGATAAETINIALAQLMANEARPVSIEVPVDVWAAQADGILDVPAVSTPAINPDQIAAAAKALASSQRPLIVVGGGAHGASAEITALAEMLQAPVTTRRQGHGVVDSRHELFVPLTVGREFWRDADVVLSIGTRLEFPLHWGTDEDLTFIVLNIDESELERRNLRGFGVHADAAEGVVALMDAIGPQNNKRDGVADLVSERRAHFNATVAAELEPQRRQLDAIRDVLPDDGVIVEDVTQVGFAAHLMFEFRHPRSFLTSGTAGALGAGVAHAIGAQAALGDRNVLGIIGDGGFLFSATELATAAQHNIPVTIIVYDNASYGNVKRIQELRFGPDRTIASDLQNPDFVKFGESFGIHTQRADDASALRPALAEAFAHNGPSLIVAAMGDMPNPWPYLRMNEVRGPLTSH